MATLYKRSNSPFWWLYYTERGQTFRQSTQVRHHNRTEPPKGSPALRILANIEERIALAHFNVPVTWQPPTVKAAIKAQADVEQTRVDAQEILSDTAFKTVVQLENIGKRLEALGIRTLADLTPDLCREYVRSRLAIVKPTSLVIEISIIARLWQRYIDEEHAPLENYWKTVKLGGDHKRKRALTDEEIRQLGNLLPDAPIAIRYLALMGYYQGARVSMAARLNVERVDFDKMLIRFPRIKRKEHTMSMHPELYNFLMDYPVLKGGWFIEPDGYWSDAFRKWIRKCRAATGLFDGVTHHCLRVTFNTKMIESDLPEQVTMKIIGHASSEVHDRYKDIEATKFAHNIAGAIRKL